MQVCFQTRAYSCVFLLKTRYMIPAVDSRANTIVVKPGHRLPVRKMVVGPSAPPIIPIELPVFAPRLNLCARNIGMTKLNAALTKVIMRLTIVNMMMVFLRFLSFSCDSPHLNYLLTPGRNEEISSTTGLTSQFSITYFLQL